MSKFKKIIKSNRFIRKVAEAIVDIYRLIIDNSINRFYWYMYGKMPIEKNKIVICNYFGRGYSDNAKYIVDEIIYNKLDYKIVWLVNDVENKDEFPSGIKLVKYKSKEAIYEMATAKLWIDNSRKIHYTRKRKNQIYIQTWHGGIALKRIEKDAGKSLPAIYRIYSKKDSKNADLFISNSKFNSKLYKNSFWYNGEILECGVPRNDMLFNDVCSTINKVKQLLNIPKGKKIILYAPTFRKDNNLDVYKLNYTEIINIFEKKFNEDFVLLIRLHPNIFNKSKELNLDYENVYNGSFYPDMQELLVASDILITDYSSSMFDFMLTKKPCFIYANDIEAYNNDRGFYFDLSNLPFCVSRNLTEFEYNICKFNYEEYLKKVNIFIEKQGCIDCGDASKKIVEWISKKL